MPTTWTLAVRRDEAVAGALLAAHLFLSVASIVLGKAARDSIFLSRYNVQQMTAVDIATMIVAALVVGVQLRLGARMSTKRLLLLSPLCFALGDLGLWAGLSAAPAPAMTPVAYLWIGIQGSFAAPQASVLACHVLTLRQAKRLCGPIGTGAILGWIGGGLLTELFAARFGASSLLLGSAALMALCPVVVALAWREEEDTRVCRPSGANLVRVPASSFEVRQSSGRRRISGPSPASRWSRPPSRPSWGSSSRTRPAGRSARTDDLAAFFGSFSVRAGLLALAAQVLLTSRLVGWLGLGLALMIAPAALAAGSLGVLFWGTLAAAVFLKGSDQILRYSVDRTAVELLYRPLSQGEILEGKTFIDALVCRVGDGMGGLIALFSALVMHVSFSRLSVISLALALVWLTSAGVAGRRYRDRLRDNLRAPPDVPAEASTSGIGSLRRWSRRPGQRDILNGNPERRLAALRVLSRARACRPRLAFGRKRLETALALEIVGLAVLTDARLLRRGASGRRPPGSP